MSCMLGDVFAGRGLDKDWMPISQIDRDMRIFADRPVQVR